MEYLTDVKQYVNMLTPAILAYHNELVALVPGKKPLKKFESREKGIERTVALAEEAVALATAAGAEAGEEETQEGDTTKKERGPRTVENPIDGLNMGADTNRARLYNALNKKAGEWIDVDKLVIATYGKDAANHPGQPALALGRVKAGVEDRIAAVGFAWKIETQRVEKKSQWRLVK